MNGSYDVVCFSHLRWGFVFQRPQHLLSRCAAERRVFFIEEAIDDPGPARLERYTSKEGVEVVVPHLSLGIDDSEAVQAGLIRDLLERENVNDYITWYYTPMALPLARELSPRAVVYDCMDQLSAFKNAPPRLTELERQLFDCADVAFTGGHSLYEAKRRCHPNIHAFPSSVDVAHFGKARAKQPDPEDQRLIPHPRLGFFGVIDERMDINLVAGVATARPDWQLILVGPVVKIDEADLPRAPNIHYLGGKQYSELPSYIANWDVALLTFARNESTEFISPTKTPEYLAAGKPVVSTSIRDVVRPYQGLGLARIADEVPDFVAACEAALTESKSQLLIKADAYLSRHSWDKTWREMRTLVDRAVAGNERKSGPSLRHIGSAQNQTLSVAAGEE